MLYLCYSPVTIDRLKIAALGTLGTLGGFRQIRE